VTAATAVVGAATEPVGAPTPIRRLLSRFRRNRAAMIASGWIGLMAFVAVAAPLVAPQNPTAQHLNQRDVGPSLSHLLGTDALGRDILSRVIYSARVSLSVAALVVLFAGCVALPVGLIAGYVGRRTDGVLMRVMDALFAFPPLMLALAVAALLGPNVINLSVAIAIPFVPGFARLVRAEVLGVREELYIEASRSVGVTTGRMLRRHILPNVVSPFIVQAALAFGYAILAEAGLSFLGFGVQPPNASWGVMLGAAFQDFGNGTAYWPMVPPGLAIAVTVLAFNLVGDGLRDALGREVFVVKPVQP
jgi:ABC-type dipeptide/oligopeptide/nickel transport system permease subunit